VRAQILVPAELPRGGVTPGLSRGAKEIFDDMLSYVVECRHGL
jgi:hypothetical protein